MLTAPGRGLGGKTNPHPAAASPLDVSGGMTGWVLVVVLPAKRIELPWGDATSLVALVKPVAWGNPRLGDLQLGHLISGGRGEMSSPGLAPCGLGFAEWGVLRLLPARLDLSMVGTILAATLTVLDWRTGRDEPGGDAMVAPNHHPTQREGSQGSGWPRLATGNRGEERAGGIYLLVGAPTCIRRAGCCLSRSGV